MGSSLSGVWVQRTQPHGSTDSEFFNAASLHCKLSEPILLEKHISQCGCVLSGYVWPQGTSLGASKHLITISRRFFLHYRNYRKWHPRSFGAFCPPLLRKTPTSFCLLFSPHPPPAPSCIRESHRKITTSIRSRIQLCSHFFPSPQAQSLEQPQIEFAPWMQTLGVVLTMLEIRWPVFMYRS